MNDVERGLALYIGEERLRRIQAVTVGIAGAGGLGSNCAMHLVRLGFRRLVVVDFDVVAPSNLNRQCFFARQIGMPKVEALAENLLAVNPDLELDMRRVKLDQANLAATFAGCAAVVEALDGAADKRLMVETFLNTGVFLVTASGLAGWGRTDGIVCHRARPNWVMVGDGVSAARTETQPGLPPLSPGVGIAAAKQADAVFTHFVGEQP